MTLQEAVEIVQGDIEDWEGIYLECGIGCQGLAEAIATILNAVVKGELKHE